VDTSLVMGARYTPPAVVWRAEVAQRQRIVWWIVFVGFAYVVALAWATYCRYTGGDADIELTWNGVKVICKGG
jgi:hypothetical protein